MKKLALAGIVSILAMVALSGCMSVPKEEDTTAPTDETTPVVEETPVATETAKKEEDKGGITDELVDKFTETYTEGRDLFYGCNEEVKAFNETLNAGKIMMYKALPSNMSDITLYKTTNPDKLTKEEVKAIVEPCAELGANRVLKVTDDYIILGYPECSAGIIPDQKFQPELYADYEDCLVVQEELYDYFGLK